MAQLPLLKLRVSIIIQLMILSAELNQTSLNAHLELQATHCFLLLELSVLGEKPGCFLQYCSLYLQLKRASLDIAASYCLPSQPALGINRTCRLFQSNSLSPECSAGNNCDRHEFEVQPEVYTQKRKVRNFAFSAHEHKGSEVRAWRELLAFFSPVWLCFWVLY